jgi:hypothetical protein
VVVVRDRTRGGETKPYNFSAHAETVETAERGGERQLKASADVDVLLTTNSGQLGGRSSKC